MNLLEVIGSLSPGSATLQESWFDPGFYDPDMDLSPSAGGAAYFRRLTQSPADLSPLVQQRMQELALYLYDKNPLAKRGLELVRDFVVGEGFTVSSKDKPTQKVIDAVWGDGRNNMDQRISTFALELGLYGEQCFAAFVHTTSGHVRYVSIDPRSIGGIKTRPGHPDEAMAVKVVGPTGSEDQWIKVISLDDEGRWNGAEPGETFQVSETQSMAYYSPPGLEGTDTYLAGCLYFAINKTSGATRGRSDLLSIMDFVDLYDKLVFDEAERMSFLRAFIYDVTIKNADGPELQKRAMNEPPPKPGTVKWHNENEEWKALSPELNAQDGATTADLVLSLIATGLGVPKTWLNGSMDVNLATATAMDGPGLKRVKTRQAFIVSCIRTMVEFALDSAVRHGPLALPKDGKHELNIHVPDMTAKDIQKGAQTMQAGIQAMGMGKAAGWVDDDTAVQAICLMLGSMGVNVEAEDLLEQIKKNREEGQDKMGDIPSYLGMGSSFGSDQLTKAIDGSPPEAGARGAEGGSPVSGAIAGPGLDPKSVTMMISQMATALNTLGTAKIIDVEVAQDVTAKFFEPLGIKIDLDAMRTRLEEEEQADAEAAAGADVAQAQAAVDAQGDGEADPNADPLAEAFDESKVHREGGKFAAKDGGSLADKMKAAGIADVGEYLQHVKDKEKEAKKGGGAAKGKGGGGAAKPKGGGKGGAEKKGGGGKGGGAAKAAPAMKGQQLKAALNDVKIGASISVTTADGQVVNGKVERKAGGMTMITREDGGTSVIHDKMTNISQLHIDGGASHTAKADDAEKPKKTTK